MTQAGTKVTRHELSVELHDKIRALDKLARHLGLYNEKLALNGEIPMLVFRPEGAGDPADD